MTVRAWLACAAVFALLAGLTIGTNPDLTVELARSAEALHSIAGPVWSLDARAAALFPFDAQPNVRIAVKHTVPAVDPMVKELRAESVRLGNEGYGAYRELLELLFR